MPVKPLDEHNIFVMLNEAREKGQPWFVKAAILKEALEKAPDDGAASRIRLSAEKATRLSAGVLRRYVSLLDRISTIAETEKVDAEFIISPVFNAAEIACRIYDRNPDEGMKALLELKAGETTLVKLRTLLMSVPVWRPEPDETIDEMRRFRAAKLISAAGFERIAVRTAFMAQAFERSPLVPPGGRLRKRLSTSLFSSRDGSFEVVTGSDGTRVTIHGGVELLGYEQDRDDVRTFERTFPAVSLLATFYPKFYLVFSPQTPPEFTAAADRLIELFATRSIGIAIIDSNGYFAVFSEPDGPPVPDRTESYASLFPSRSGEPAPIFSGAF